MSTEAWNENWCREIEEALAHLESAVDQKARADWRLNPFADQPPVTPHQHVMVAQSYMSNLNVRLALRQYEKVLALSPELADPHWGLATSLYSLAILDMLVRGLCKTSKTNIRLVARRLSAESYLRREIRILAQGALTFQSVAKVMRDDGWQPLELVGAIAIGMGRTPGLIPDARDAMDSSRSSLPTELVPLATFMPDDRARAILALSAGRFVVGDLYEQIRVPPNTLNFFDYEMRSVHGRVEDLLRHTSPGAAPTDAPLGHVRSRFDRVRGESSVGFELLARFRANALRNLDPVECVHAGAMFLAGAFYTVAEEMFQKALQLLPISTEALWGLAQAVYGLALFDLVDRERFDIAWHEVDAELVTRLRKAPVKYDVVAVMGLSTAGPYDRVFVRKGLPRSQVGTVFSLLDPGQGGPMPARFPIPVWRPDEDTLVLWRVALEYAERAAHGVSDGMSLSAFDPADLRTFHDHLLTLSGRAGQPHATRTQQSETVSDPFAYAKNLYGQRRFEEAAEIFDQYLRDNGENAETWNWLANCQIELEDYASAVHSFDEAIRLEPSDPRNWNDKGVSLRRAYRFGEALDCFRVAASLNTGSPIPSHNVDDTLRAEQSLRESVRHLVAEFDDFTADERARFYRANFAFKKAQQLQTIGQRLQATRWFDDAAKEYRELPRCQQLEWAALEMFCEEAEQAPAGPPSVVIAARLRLRELVSHLRLQDPSFQDEALERETAIRACAALLAGGRWENALWMSTELVNECQRQRNSRDELRCLELKGSALQSIGALSEAERVYVKVLQICYLMADVLEPAELVLHELGYAQTLLSLHRFDEVRASAARARERALSFGLTELAHVAQMLDGSGLFGLGQYNDAYVSFSQTLSRIQNAGVGTPRMEAYLGRLLHHTGKSLLRLGRVDEALDMHRAALRTERAWWSHEGVSCALEAQTERGHLAEALSARLRAIEQAEAGSKAFSVSEFQLSWFEDKTDVYANAASQLLRMTLDEIPLTEHDLRKRGQSIEELALHFADRGKGRTLLQLVAAASGASGSHSALLAQRRAVADEIGVLLARRGPVHRPGARHQFEMDTQQIEEQLAREREIEGQLRKAGHAAFIEPDLLNARDFQSSLKPGEACIEYSLTETRLLILVVTTQDIQAHQIDVPRRAPQSASRGGSAITRSLAELYRQNPLGADRLGIEGLVQLHRDWMDHWQQSVLSESEHVRVSAALARVVLPPAIRSSLSARDIKHLLIVPSHSLTLTPFSTLVLETDPNASQPMFRDCRFVVDAYSVSFVQSIGVLNAIRQRERRRSTESVHGLVAFADPVHYESDPRASRAAPDAPTKVEEDAKSVEGSERRILRGLDVFVTDSTHETWPRLEETQAEVLAVGRRFRDHVVIDSPIAEFPATDKEAVLCVGHAANRDVALSPAMQQCRNILFSVHGRAELSNPWLSHLILTDRRTVPGSRRPVPLTMTDAFNMILDADTIVLAACETGLGPVRQGEGIVGFPLAFLYAGARSVLLTQWQIPSGFAASPGIPETYPSTTVVTGFYENWREMGMSLAEALRQAQLTLRSEHVDFKDPFFWGAWQLYGEWRAPKTHSLQDRERSATRRSSSSSVSTVAHPAADPDRAARLNIEYIEALKRWEALPLWRRVRAKKPERPTGI